MLSTMLELARLGPEPLASRRLDLGDSLRVAVVIPSFRRGSGGHATIVSLTRGLRERGHSVSLWLEDCEGRHASESAAATERSFHECFGGDGLRLHTDFGVWQPVDVVLATGWQTVARALRMPEVHARAYLVQDHEPDFYGASAEAMWAAHTYRQGLYCVAASPWLAALLRSRYGANATHLDLAVDHSVYHPAGTVREEKLVAFYARAVTARRAVPLGLLALAELARRRPDVKIALFGEDRPLSVPFDHANLGVLPSHELAALYSRATVGMVFSLTNPSLIGLEMMACGLPCVELASESTLATFNNGPLTLVEPDALELCAALERLLDDPDRRTAAGRGGIESMTSRTWSRAAEQLEQGLIAAVRADR